MPAFRPLCRLVAALAVVLTLAASASPVVGDAANGGALWRVVHDLCVPDMRLSGHPAPCAKVDLAQGYAVLKDLENPTQLVLAPTDRLTGIEDPRLIRPGAPNYWAMGWDNRDLLIKRARHTVAREHIGLAVNSVYARTQNQLHIHIDCASAEVVAALSGVRRVVGPEWRALPIRLAGHRYDARWLSQEELAQTDPFRLLAELPDARRQMGRQTLVLIAAVDATGAPGFMLLRDAADPALQDRAHGEELLDHSCEGAAAD